MQWIDAKDVKAGDVVWLPYGQLELHVWEIEQGDGVIVFAGSVRDPKRPGVRRQVSGAKHTPTSPLGLIRHEQA